MASELKVVQYLVDTRELWPGATKTAQLENEAPRAFAVLTQEERDKILRFYWVADAKMSLVSQLLKHWAVARYAGVPWAETQLTRDARTKPVYVDGQGRQPVSFNVSHQAGLVALVVAFWSTDSSDSSHDPIDVGIDVVCTSERRERDHRTIRASGWGAGFVDMHSDVFGHRETAFLKGLGDGKGDLRGGARFDGKAADDNLRLFYTLWCLREAYIKMTGDALLASWLRDLDFVNFRAPAPGATERDGDSAVVAQEGEAVTSHEIVFQGAPVTDANVCIRSLGPHYMVCTAVRTPARTEDALALDLRSYRYLSLEDILEVAGATAT